MKKLLLTLLLTTAVFAENITCRINETIAKFDFNNDFLVDAVDGRIYKKYSTVVNKQKMLITIYRSGNIGIMFDVSELLKLGSAQAALVNADEDISWKGYCIKNSILEEYNTKKDTL